jgi:hypothetical protein
MNYRILYAILLLITFSGLTFGQSFSEKKIIRKSVRVNKETTLELINKYGTIHITPGTTDSVLIRVETEATASSLERLRKVFDGININISETSYMVRAQTDFNQNISMLFESFKGMTSKIIPYDSKIEINYFVTAPDYINLKIDNKYGDVYMENNMGVSTITISNGSFKANKLDKVSGMNFTFCDAKINSVNEGTIDASFSELIIGESKNLIVNSVSSRFDLKKAIRINAKSRRDKYFIGSVESISGDSYFSDYSIDVLSKEINLLPKYGSINVDLIEESIELISIKSSFTDISLDFEPSVSYNVDIRHINAFVVLPDQDTKVEKKTINEDKREYMTFGTVGRNPGKSRVIIDATRGNIYLK